MAGIFLCTFVYFFRHTKAWLYVIIKRSIEGGFIMPKLITKKEFLFLIAQSIIDYRKKHIREHVSREFGEEASSEVLQLLYSQLSDSSGSDYYYHLFVRWGTYYNFVRRNGGNADALLKILSSEKFYLYNAFLTAPVRGGRKILQTALHLLNAEVAFPSLGIIKESFYTPVQSTQEILGFLKENKLEQYAFEEDAQE